MQTETSHSLSES